VITVLVGQLPKWRRDDAAFVHIAPDAQIDLIDLRPLVGLWVAMFVTIDETSVAAAVLERLERVKVKFYGAADLSGTYPCVADATDRHHTNLRLTWEALCR
jgi:hypothetical protein